MFQSESDKDESLTSLFITETHDQLEQFSDILINWNKCDDSKKNINELFRLAHNIKGSSGMMGLVELKDAIHGVEDLFDAVRKEKMQLDSEIIDSLLKFSDDVLLYIESGQWQEIKFLRHWRNFFNLGLVAEASLNLVKKLENPLILSKTEKETIAAWQETGKIVYGIEVEFNPEGEMQGASALIFMRMLPQYGKVCKTVPREENLREEKFTVFHVIIVTDQELTAEQEYAITSYPIYDAITVRMRKWSYRSEESSASPKKINDKDGHLTERTIRVETEKIDRLVNQVGELIHVKASLFEFFNQKKHQISNWSQLRGIIEKLEAITEELKNEVKDLRMIPVRNIFSRFSRIVYDISKQKGKQVQLEFLGEDTEIDKQVAEQLVDPLIHLVRNAVDHGLESEEVRIKKGKSRIGRVTMSAYQTGNNIVINVQDDGQGLDLEKIKIKGIQSGLIQESQAITEEDIKKLIFEPGFSTADIISDISGRGVGLDVVHDSIKKLKGEIIVDSQPDQGTVFHLKIPLTLAIVQLFLIKVGGQIFGIPIFKVAESIAVSEADIHHVIADNDNHHIKDKLIIMIRQEAIPLINLRNVFQYSPVTLGQQKLVIIVREENKNYGLLVEELIGQEELMIKQINKALTVNPLISGAAFVGSGDIALILDIHQIIKKYVCRYELTL